MLSPCPILNPSPCSSIQYSASSHILPSALYTTSPPCLNTLHVTPSPCPSSQPSSSILDVLSICLVGMTSLIRCCVCERRWTLILLQQSSVCMRAQHPGADRRHSVLDAASTHPVCPKNSASIFFKAYIVPPMVSHQTQIKTECIVLFSIGRGGSKIFLEEGASTPKVGVLTYYFAIFLPKTV